MKYYATVQLEMEVEDQGHANEVLERTLRMLQDSGPGELRDSWADDLPEEA